MRDGFGEVGGTIRVEFKIYSRRFKSYTVLFPNTTIVLVYIIESTYEYLNN